MFTLKTWECDRCNKEFEAYDYGSLCEECESKIEEVLCGGCDFFRDYGYDYTYCNLFGCSKEKLTDENIEFCKKVKVSQR